MAARDDADGRGPITAWRAGLTAPVRTFLHAETGGAAVMVGAVVLALIWSNVDPGSYDEVWETQLAISLGDHGIALGLREWVNQGLMTLFFLVVGLEAKRELDLGELRERRRLVIPALCAVGGMAAAAAAYLAVNAGGDAAHGWGVAVSSDTALALGALALLSRGRAVRLRVVLVTMFVVDDLIALAVIALAYTNEIDLAALAAAVVLFGVLLSLRWVGQWRRPAAVIVGVGIWLALFESGIDPVIAGLAVGLVTSAYPPAREDLERTTDLIRSFREQPTPELAYEARAGVVSALSPNERLQFRLHPWTSRVIVPVFALANAGVQVDTALLSDAVGSPITLGIVAAFLVGKPAGIMGAAWLAQRARLGPARMTITRPALFAGATASGIGFTVSLLIAGRAFEGQDLDEAKIGALATVLLAPALAWVVMRVIRRIPPEVRARQLGSTAGVLTDLADDVDLDRDHIRGNPAAPVTIVEYGDYQCPYCGHAAPVIEELLGRLADELRFVFRHLPLPDVHPEAERAAQAAEAAAAQDAFWPMHDRLMHHQDALDDAGLLAHAGAAGLDVERFAADLASGRFAERVGVDVRSADASGVSGTPTFFVNGRRHQGVYDVDILTDAVHRAAREVAMAAAAR